MIRRYKWLKEQLKRQEDILLEAERIIEEGQKNASMLHNWITELGAYICPDCDGDGEVYSVVSQSENHLTTFGGSCDTCGGNGLREKS